MLTLVTHYPPEGLSTTRNGRCLYCGHVAGKQCICATCDNHGQVQVEGYSQPPALAPDAIARILAAIDKELD